MLWSFGYQSLWQPQMLQTWRALEFPSAERQGTGAGQNWVSWPVQRLRLQQGAWVAHLLLRGCGYSIVAGSAGEGQLSLQCPRPMLLVLAALGHLI